MRFVTDGIRVWWGARFTPGDTIILEPERISRMVRQSVGLDQKHFKQERIIGGEWVQRGESNDVILYLHGGAHMFMSPASHRSITARLAERANVYALDYRRAPECIFPDAVEDAVAAYAALIGRSEARIQHMPRVDRVLLAGDSSGACLVLQVLLVLQNLDLPPPSGAILISPFLDHSLTAESWLSNADTDYLALDRRGMLWALGVYAGSLPLNHPFISPLGHPRLDRITCPILVHVGSNEVLLDDSLTLARTLSSVTLQVYEGQVHVFHAFTGMFPGIDHAFNSIDAWMARIGKGGRDSAVCSDSGVEDEGSYYTRVSVHMHGSITQQVFY